MSWILAWTLIDWLIRLGMVPVIFPRRRFLPATALAWLGVIFFIPWVGLGLYLLIGSNRLGRLRIRRYHKVIIAKRSDDRFSGKQGYTTRPDLGTAHLRVIVQAERITGMPILAGNSVELVGDYQGIIDRLIVDIDSARHHVHLLYYIFAPDETGRRVADALLRAVGRGVKCRLLADAAASREIFGFGGLAEQLNRQGVETYPMLPAAPLRRKLARIDLRNHRKLAVIDCRVAYAGSQNIVNADYGRIEAAPAIDLMGRFAGPVVAQLQSVFVEDWEFETGEILAGPELFPEMQRAGTTPAQVVATGPSPEIEALPRVILAALNTAQERIVITTPYLVPDEPTLFALTMAAERGVDVTVIVPEHSDHALVSAAARAYFEPLMASGVNIFLHRPGMLHAKSITVDNAIALLGSSNLDMRSFHLNFELTVLLYGPEVTQQLRAAQLRYLDDCIHVDPDVWACRPGIQQYIDSAAALFSPLL